MTRLKPSRDTLATVIAAVWRGRLPEGHDLYVADDGVIWIYELPAGVHTFVDFAELRGETARALVAAADVHMAAAVASHLKHCGRG